MHENAAAYINNRACQRVDGMLEPPTGARMHQMDSNGQTGATRAEFLGVLGPETFMNQYLAQCETRPHLAEMCHTVACNDRGRLATYFKWLNEHGKGAVPEVVASGEYTPAEMRDFALYFLTQVKPAVLQHANTQQLLQVLYNTKENVHLLAVYDHGISLFHPSAPWVFCEAQDAFLRSMSLLVKAMQELSRQGAVHGAVHEDAVVVLNNRLILTKWRLEDEPAAAAAGRLHAAYTSMYFVPGQHPCIWMLWLCWMLNLDGCHSTGQPRMSLRGCIDHLFGIDNSTTASMNESHWLFYVRNCLGGTVQRDVSAWFVGVLDEIYVASNCGMYIALEAHWDRMWADFRAATKPDTNPYTDTLKAAGCVGGPTQTWLNVRSNACQAGTEIHVSTHKMLNEYFSGRIPPGENVGKNAHERLCMHTDMYYLCQQLWQALYRYNAMVVGSREYTAFRAVLGADFAQMQTTTSELVQTLRR